MTSDPNQNAASGGTAERGRAEEAPSRGHSPWSLTATQNTGATSGWLSFAGTMLLLTGIFNLISGFASLFRPDYYLIASGELLVFNYTAWAWIWFVLGIVQVAAGLGVLAGQAWARTTGVVLAGLCAIGHVAFLAAFPLWSLLVIAMSVLVIYALVVPPTRISV